MKLILTDDDGVVLEQWYIPGKEYDNPKFSGMKLPQVRSAIESVLEVYESKEEWETLWEK